MYTKLREEPLFESTSPYTGNEVTYNILFSSEYWRIYVIGKIYECVLWMFQFRMAGDPKNMISQYFGVMDIDIDREEGMSDNEYEMKKFHYLPVLIDKLHRMDYHSYRIYQSGTKGYHVYLFDLKFWRIPTITDEGTHNLWIEQQIKHLYPELYEELDYNIYHIDKGIRNPLWPHPDTKKASTLLVEKNAPPCIWNWICDVFPISKPVQVPFDRTIPPRAITTATATGASLNPALNTQTRRTRKTIFEELKDIYKVEPTLKAGNLYLVNSKYCPLKGSDHKDRGKNYIHLGKDHAVIKCHHANCSGKEMKVMNGEEPLTNFYLLQQQLLESSSIKHTTRRLRIIKPESQKYVSSEDIDWSFQETGLGIISAPMGTGKTTSLVKWIDEERKKEAKRREDEGKQPKKFKVLLLVTRITQAINFSSKYPGMKSYLEVDGSIADNESSVLCVNSLMKAMQEREYSVPKYDLIILDEIESIIESLISPSMSQGKTKQCNIFQLFKCLVVGSKRTLFMDGILTQRTARFLDRIEVLERCNLVQHEGQPDYRQYINFRSKEVFEQDFDLSCSMGKKVVIVSNSKSALYSLVSRNQTDSSLVITGDSSKNEKLTASDPNEEWTKNILGFNTAVGPGASFDSYHFDIMYVVCSPISCTPYALYQLINRIRTLKEKTVKVFVLYNETDKQKLPSREELKLVKSQNIIKLHSKQDDYAFPLDFYKKVDTDYIKLDLNNIDYSVLRKLIQEKKVVLYYEDTHFVDTLIDYEYEKLRFSDTSYYCQVLFDIIRRNGGLVKGLTDYENITDDDKKFLKTSTRSMIKDGNKNYKELALSSDNVLTKKLPINIDREYKEKINQCVQLNNINSQIMWSTLRRVLTKSEMTVYEKELEGVNEKRKAVNNTLLYSVGLLESLKAICDLCGLKIDQARGIILGSGDYGRFTNNHKTINEHIEIIEKQLYNATKKKLNLKPLKDTRMPNDTATFKNLKLILSEFGVNLNLDKTTRPRKVSVRETKERYFEKIYEVCEFSQYIRMAFSGLAFDTGLPIEEPFTYLKNNYKK